MSAAPALSSEAAMVLGLAGTAMPFARSRQEQAERWLRVLRLHGAVGSSLEAVGVGEAPPGDGVRAGRAGRQPLTEGQPPAEPADDGEEVVGNVTELAAEAAARRGAQVVESVDVLVGAMDFYGEDFERLLLAYGTDRAEVLEHALA